MGNLNTIDKTNVHRITNNNSNIKDKINAEKPIAPKCTNDKNAYNTYDNAICATGMAQVNMNNKRKNSPENLYDATLKYAKATQNFMLQANASNDDMEILEFIIDELEKMGKKEQLSDDFYINILGDLITTLAEKYSQ